MSDVTMKLQGQVLAIEIILKMLAANLHKTSPRVAMQMADNISRFKTSYSNQLGGLSANIQENAKVLFDSQNSVLDDFTDALLGREHSGK